MGESVFGGGSEFAFRDKWKLTRDTTFFSLYLNSKSNKNYEVNL